MTKKEILKILDEHADKNYGDIYTNQHQEIAKDLLKYFKKQLLIQRVSNRFEKYCDSCEHETEHRIIHACLKCDGHL